MATHRRGLRPSQWPVRDLLGPDGDRGRLWDARIGAALAGLLACGAAVTVVLTAGDTASSGGPSGTPQPRTPEPDTPQPGMPQSEPWALPPSTAFVPAPAEPPAWRTPPPTAVPPVPDVAEPVRADPRRSVPVPAPHTDRPVTRPRRAPAPVPPATAPAREPDLAEQIAAGLEQWERRSPDQPVVGWVLVPVQRPADAAALLELACGGCTTAPSAARHQAPEHGDRADRPREGGRHRAPDPDDDRPDRDRSAHDRDERDDRNVSGDRVGTASEDDRTERDRDGAHQDDHDRDDHDRDDESRTDQDHAEQGEHERSTPDRVADDVSADDEPDQVQRTAADDRDAPDPDDRDADAHYTGWFDAA